MRLNSHTLCELVYGGAILGAGGGGSIEAGLVAGRRALAAGTPRLIPLSALAPDACLVTFSNVGTVMGKGGVAAARDYHTRALELFSSLSKTRPDGIIPSEVGALAVTYGWLQSAQTNIPIVDAPCNGRAHPLGLMGSLGLHRQRTYKPITVAVGGHAASYTELMIRTTVDRAATLVRAAVARLGISLAVLRNPISAAYVREHAAVGGLMYARHVGRVFLAQRPHGLNALLNALCTTMGGRVVGAGRVASVSLANRHGFTLGEIVITRRNGETLRLAVCNEYMSVGGGAALHYAFPDLICVIGVKTCLPMNSGEVKAGQPVVVFGVPRSRLKLSSTMGDSQLLHQIPKLIGDANM